MKKLFLSGIILFLAISMNAQGNMQFNQVKRFTYSGTVSTYLSSTGDPVTLASVVVPAGKVWKIESGSIFSSYSSSGMRMSTADMTLFIDNQIISIGESNSGSNQRNAIVSSPIWLGAGTYNISYYCGNVMATSYKAAISAIEFNIVQ